MDAIITQEHIEQAKGYGNLGPAYFASRDIAERAMAGFEAEHFKPLIDKFGKDFADALWDSVRDHLLSDTELNIQGSMWHQVDQIMQGALSGEKWIMDRYVLGEKYDCGKVRETIAKYIGEELAAKRIEDLEAEVAKLKEELAWARKFR